MNLTIEFQVGRTIVNTYTYTHNMHLSRQFLRRLYNNWRPSCKKGLYIGFWANFHFLQDRANLADWLVLTWKAWLRNFFGPFALRFAEITYAKKPQFCKGHLCERIFRKQILTWCKCKRLLLAASTARFCCNRCFGF